MPDKILTKIRNRKMKAQSGLCYYCQAPMWMQNIKAYCAQYGLSEAQALAFKCTAEHLIARQDNGKTTDTNIAAACLSCNQKRHQVDNPLSAHEFKQSVRSDGKHI